MKKKESEHTLVVLANAGDLVNNIAQGVIGNEVADTFAGSPLTGGVVYNLAQTQFQAAVTKIVGGI
jgi:hypothetical protein